MTRLEQPTVGLRFVERDGKKILQQNFRIEYPQEGKMKMEWRDVKVEIESNHLTND